MATVRGSKRNIPGLAVLGIGAHARVNILPALIQCPSVRLVGISTRDEQVRREQATAWGCKAYATPTEMLGDPEVEVVYLTLPIGLHAHWGHSVLDAGKHLWCEKSLASTEADWTGLVAHARSKELALCEAFMFLHHPQFAHIEEILRRGDLGNVRSVTARFGFPHRRRDDVRYSALLGGGALLDSGCYPVRAALSIHRLLPRSLDQGLNPTPNIEVSSFINRDEGYDVDTSGSALVRFDSGVHFHLEWGFGRFYRNEIEIWGEEGVLLADRAFSKPANFPSKLVLTLADGSHTQDTGSQDQFVAMLENFSKTLYQPQARELQWEETEQQKGLLFRLLPSMVGNSVQSHPDHQD